MKKLSTPTIKLEIEGLKIALKFVESIKNKLAISSYLDIKQVIEGEIELKENQISQQK